MIRLFLSVLFTIPLLADPAAARKPSPDTYKLCITPIWEPFSFLNRQGRFDGILADYEKLISEKSGLRFTHVYTKDYKENKRYVLEGKCDLSLADVKDDTNSKRYLITHPYATFPRAYATHTDTPWSVDFSHLLNYGKRVGVVFGAPAKNFLLKHYKGIEVVEFKDTEAGLKALSSKSITAFVNILPTIAYTIQINGFNDIKIGGYMPGDIPLSMFVNKQHPELYARLNRAITRISERERLDILDRWVHIQKGIAYDTVLRFVWIALLLFGLLALLLFVSRRNNQKLKNLLNASIEGVILFKDGLVTAANRPALRLFGYRHFEKIKGKPIEAFYGGEVVPDGEIAEVELKSTDGSVFPAHVKFSSLDAFQSSTIVSVIDLTRVKKAEKALQELNATLRQKVDEEVEKNLHQQFVMIQQNRLAQMGEMISMIAHQWRQPLNNLSLMFQTFLLKHQMGKLDDATVRKLRAESKKQIDFMSGTIDDFRDFFKPSREKSECRLDAVIVESIGIIAPAMEKEGIGISTQSCGDVTLYLYASELKQVIINILNNARDALAESTRADKRIMIETICLEHAVTIRIADNGGGIPEAIIERVFDPYFSTKMAKNGTGIGLYMSKKIVEEYLDGTLSVINESEGALFTITLHTVPDPDQNHARTPAVT